MKIEIKKEYDNMRERDFYNIYLDGHFRDCALEKEDAIKKLGRIKDSILNPAEPEIVHSEEF